MNILASILGLLCLASLPWGFGGLWKPKLVLWWAVAEKQTRLRALGFAITLSLCLFCYTMSILPGSLVWWFWIVLIISTLMLICVIASFRTTKAETEAIIKEQARTKKANITHTVYSMNSDNEYEIRPFLAMCSCPDWRKKRSGADGPFGVCKHLANHYVCHQNEIPENLLSYKDMFLSFSLEEKGMPPQGEVYGHGVIDGMAYIFTGYADSLPWVNVYIDTTGTQRYGFNMESGKWAMQEEPFHAEELAKRIARFDDNLDAEVAEILRGNRPEA